MKGWKKVEQIKCRNMWDAEHIERDLRAKHPDSLVTAREHGTWCAVRRYVRDGRSA